MPCHGVARELPQLPPELLEAYKDERMQLYHPVRGAACIKQISRLSIMLRNECTLLQKIRYKQQNQHKAATWWRHISGSQRVCLRLLEQLNGGLVPNLPTVEDKQPVLSGQSLFLLTESSVRVSFLLDATLSSHIKSAAATQQLLRAALFMPLAMTLKALIARLHTTWKCLKDEIQVFLTLLRGTPKRKSRLAQDLDKYVAGLPKELRRYWTSTSPKKPKVSQEQLPLASTSVSAVSSAVPSRTQSPATAKGKERARSTLSQARTPVEQDEMVVESLEGISGTVAAGSDGSDKAEAVADERTAALPAVEKKVKKRKKPRAVDDIDAIFAGL